MNFNTKVIFFLFMLLSYSNISWSKKNNLLDKILNQKKIQIEEEFSIKFHRTEIDIINKQIEEKFKNKLCNKNFQFKNDNISKSIMQKINKNEIESQQEFDTFEFDDYEINQIQEEVEEIQNDLKNETYVELNNKIYEEIKIKLNQLISDEINNFITEKKPCKNLENLNLSNQCNEIVKNY